MITTENPANVLAIDIGGTKLAIGIVSKDGDLLASLRCPTLAHEGPDAVLSRILDLSRTLLKDHPVTAVGVGCGGPLDAEKGIIKNPPNLPGWLDYPLGDLLRQNLGLPVFIDNDANAAALAEYRFGAGRGTRHMVYLTLSTGIGGGIIIDGRLYRGKHGNAGELGHISIKHDGRKCNCGNSGCLEAYCSGTSIAKRARELAAEHPGSVLEKLAGTVEGIRAETVLEALRQQDPLTTSFWEETLDMLASGITSVIHTFDPERIVLGGGITNFGPLLFEPLRARVNKITIPDLNAGVDIVPAELGNHVGILGAAAVALQHQEQEVLA
ncbi:ROK family protein [Deinococcus cellulosilyticus]|uniref:Glucokinase n=1 Tax=Deinococcus cellulosilyticus (strain DSM 18568 / NBRC 106333 / KACC 11606 / 5516J-15) TaxID=1223518 RepID=A0A511N2M6_DEIC1|nr:ROK family protein [Deinococcus cellulosilyticus]GEM46767.1 glucokinase [Deinococcus cellulosilyticus NBRC 106333 = KACC 11606]